jgi:membrane protease YdiL (CAAX protease family)
MERLEAGLGGWTAPLAGLALAALAGVYFCFRLRREAPVSTAPAPAGSAWLAFLLAQFGAILWTTVWLAARPGPLAVQWLHSGFLLLALWSCRKWLGWEWRPGWWRWSLAAYALALAGSMLYGAVMQPEPSVNPAVDWFLQSRGVERVGWLLLLCGLTPLVEEGFYRGLLSGPTPARLLLAALFFGAVHVDPTAFVPLTWLGLVFSWARWKGSLPSAVLAHGLWNATVAVWLLGGLKG